MHTRFLALALVLAAPSIGRADNAQVEKEIIDLVQKEWAAEMKGDAEGMIKSKSKDLTMFDFGNPYRTDYTIDNSMVRHETKPGAVLAEHMVEPKVQVYGDVAILTYCFVGLSKGEGGRVSHDYLRGTRVYVKQNGQWMWVHGHFSSAAPQP